MCIQRHTTSIIIISSSSSSTSSSSNSSSSNGGGDGGSSSSSNNNNIPFRGNVVGVTSMRRAWRSWVWVPMDARDFTLLPNTQISYGVQ